MLRRQLWGLRGIIRRFVSDNREEDKIHELGFKFVLRKPGGNNKRHVT
jgi:hypothetical protein